MEAMGKPELLGLGKALERRLNLQKKEKKVASQMTAEELREEIRRLRTRVTDQANKHPFVRRKDGQPAVWQGEIALEYTWQVSDVVTIDGYDALTAQLESGAAGQGRVTKAELEGMEKALQEAQKLRPRRGSMTPEQLVIRVKELRQQWWATEEGRQAEAKAERVRQDQMRAQEEGETGGPEDGEMGNERTPTQLRQDRKRRSEVWAADYLATPEGKDKLSQPCEFTLRDRIPFAMKPAVVGAYIESLANLQAAAKQRCAQDTLATRKREIGAWVVVLRLFPQAILRDQATTAKGGRKGGQDVRRALDGWAQGDYQTCFQQERKYRPPKKGWSVAQPCARSR